MAQIAGQADVGRAAQVGVAPALQPVHAEAAVVQAQAAPGGQQPAVAPEKQSQRQQRTLAVAAVFVAVIHPKRLVGDDGVAQRRQPLARVIARRGRVQRLRRQAGGPQHRVDAAQRRLRRGGGVPVRPGRQHARAHFQRRQFARGKRHRRRREAGFQPIALAGFAVERRAAGHQIRHIAVDSARRHFQPFGQLPGSGAAAAAQQQEDLNQSVGSAHI